MVRAQGKKPKAHRTAGLAPPTADRLGGSVQVVSSTNGDLLPTEENRLESKAGSPVHAQQQPEVEVVEETKYVSLHFVAFKFI